MNDLKEQFSNKINEAVIDDNPFDHLYIENFFEDNLYTKILSNIPNVDKFQKILDGKYVDSNHIVNFINKNKNIHKINSHIIRNQGLELNL